MSILTLINREKMSYNRQKKITGKKLTVGIAQTTTILWQAVIFPPGKMTVFRNC